MELIYKLNCGVIWFPPKEYVSEKYICWMLFSITQHKYLEVINKYNHLNDLHNYFSYLFLKEHYFLPLMGSWWLKDFLLYLLFQEQFEHDI